MAAVNFFDAFKYEWAQGAASYDWNDAQWKAGWATIGSTPPSVSQFDGQAKIIDQKVNWLFNQLETAADEYDLDLAAGDVETLRNLLLLGGGLPRYTPYVWGGLASAMPRGDIQSSGQQLLDLMFPDARAEIVASQFTCTEAEWQADPYKRVTHWSLGDGESWFRCPDKNGVQPGNLGAFYGVGANPSGALLGTAVLDAMQGHFHTQQGNPSIQYSVGSNYRAADAGGTFNAGATGGPISDGVNGAPRIAAETRPRTWYGIWMIRMYGRVTNPGELDVSAIMSRLDLLEADLASGRDSGLVALTTAGTHTWTVPDVLKSGKKKAKVTVVGGGGGGAEGPSGKKGGGGGGGGTGQGLIDLTGVASVSVTVAAGGVGGVTVSVSGGIGGTSSFGAFISATGGQPGGGVSTAGGQGGAAVGADISCVGGFGSDGPDAAAGGGSGDGGSSTLGGGGRSSGSAGYDGGRYGGGGGGGVGGVGGGGNGANGVVIIEW